jgi:predicted MFS family arabinose efflux permease
LGLDPGFAGLYLSLAYAGSALAGLVVSAVGEGAARATARAVALLLAFAVLLAAVAAVATPWALGAALLVAGAPLAPLSALGTMVLQRAVPAGDHAAAFSMFFAAVAVGAGLGNALAAVLLQSLGPRWLLLGAALLVAAAASVLRARRRT